LGQKGVKAMEKNIKGSYQDVKVLYVEDDKFSREKMLRILERRFANVLLAESGDEGYMLYKQNHPNIIITDIKLDKMNSLEMIEKIRQQDDQIQIIVTTAIEDSELLLQLIENNINHFILKPIDLEKFLLAIQKSVVHIELERKLEKQRELNSFLMNFQDNLIFVIENEKIIEANRAFAAFTGFDSAQSPDTSTLLTLFVNEANYFFPKKPEKWLEELFTEHNGMAKVKWKTANGKAGIFLIKATIILEEKQYLFVCTDITNLEVEYRKNELLVNLDPMTRTYNRLKFLNILTHEIESAERTHFPFSIILLDIDDFQRINEKFGYSFGDEVLSTLATIVQQLIGESDVFARWAGKEFILLIPNVNQQTAVDLAESIRTLISEFQFQGVGSITCSFGITEFSQGKSKNKLLREVDQALLFSKWKGKNCVNIFQEQENGNKVGVLGV
jgi:two-component system, cell cycle response regulator